MKATDRKIQRHWFTTGLVLALVFCVFCPSVQAQTQNTFTSDTEFALPDQNGSIRFAVNGSYTEATLKNGSWVFTNLVLNNSAPIGSLTVSARNSQITIYMFYSYDSSGTFGRIAILNYYAQGRGEQFFDFGLNLNRTTHQSEWSVIVPANPDGSGSDFLAEGKAWHLYSNNTVAVEGLQGNISVAYFGYRANLADDSNQPFIVRHSVAIATIIIVSSIVAVAAIISLRGRRKP